MKSHSPPPADSSRSGLRLIAIIVLGCLTLALIFILRPATILPPVTPPAPDDSTSAPATPARSGHRVAGTQPRQEFTTQPARTAEEIVADKLSRFGSSREELVAAMAKHFNVDVPDEVNRFFAAVQAGNWPETTNLFAYLRENVRGKDRLPGLEHLWSAILETYGAAEQTHLWPAQKLLDYGNAVLDSLRPGMIYVGGTDEGRFIPTLLNATGEGEPHIVLTQNALADGSYLEYLRFQYSDKLNTLTAEDSQNAFQAYMADAQKRLKHDQDFPNEPKQVRPGEDIQMSNGRVQVSGQVAVMAINEQLLKTLLQNNPAASFALQESFPFKSIYGDATTLGPITEIRASDPASTLTPERAAQSLDYWRNATQPLLADPDAASVPRDAYAKLILGQASLFEDRKLSGEAEQAYQLVTSLTPGNSEAVFRYVSLLMQQKRVEEARQIARNAVNSAPGNEQFREVLARLSQTK